MTRLSYLLYPTNINNSDNPSSSFSEIINLLDLFLHYFINFKKIEYYYK